jgi:hypothetical protein
MHAFWATPVRRRRKAQRCLADRNEQVNGGPRGNDCGGRRHAIRRTSSGTPPGAGGSRTAGDVNVGRLTATPPRLVRDAVRTRLPCRRQVGDGSDHASPGTDTVSGSSGNGSEDQTYRLTPGGARLGDDDVSGTCCGLRFEVERMGAKPWMTGASELAPSPKATPRTQ